MVWVGSSITRSNLHRHILFQVSTLRPSDADEKKFYIFSGTKTLHLRAESKEDRTSWLEALQVGAGRRRG